MTVPFAGAIDIIAAFAVDVHAGMKLIRASAERIAAKAEFVIDLAEMSPHRRQNRPDRCFCESPKLRCRSQRCLAVRDFVTFLWAAAVKCVFARRSSGREYSIASAVLTVFAATFVETEVLCNRFCKGRVCDDTANAES